MQEVSPAVNTEYFVTVTDQNGCTSAPDDVVITVVQQPVVVAEVTIVRRQLARAYSSMLVQISKYSSKPLWR